MGLKNKVLLVFCSFLLVVAMISAVNAEIVFSQLKPLYNLGDELSSTVTITTINPGYLDINLVCDGKEKNLYHNVPDAKTITLKRILVPSYIDDLSGDCIVSAAYGDDSGQSGSFTLSNNIKITLETSNQIYDAGKIAIIKGKAVKENGINLGTPAQGFIDISLNEDIKSGAIIKDGGFNVNFSIPETTHAGNYSLSIKIYDKDNQDNILNSADANLAIEVRQKPSKIDLAVDKTSLVPGDNITIIPFLSDKAGDKMNYPVLLQIKDSSDAILYEGIVDANQELVLKTKTNNIAGTAKITAQKDTIVAEKTIEILKLKKLNATMENQTLILTNIGNVPYNQVMQFQVGNETVMKEVVLGLNETIAYDISAPDGTYDVNIKDDSSEILSQSGISITGNVISIEEARAKVNNFITEYPVVWIFILLVLAGFLLSWFKKYQHTMFLGVFHEKKDLISLKEKRGGIKLVLPKSEKLDQVQFKEKKGYQQMESVKTKNPKTNQEVEKINIHGGTTKAEQVLILHGPKNQVSVIAIKVKSGKPTGMARDNLAKALEYAYDKKGTSYISGDYVIIVFSPLVTKNKDNETTAIRVAQEIGRFLDEHNHKFRDGITYGIAVNSGELINKIEDNTLKFVSIEKTVNQAKKLAEISSGEVLLSKDIHLKTQNSVKVDKVQNSGVEAFKIKRMVDTQAGEKFIKEFLRRN